MHTRKNIRTAASILKHVRLHWLSVDHVLHVFALIDSESSQAVQNPQVDAFSTISNDTNYDLLPCIASPYFARLACGEVSNILHHTVERPAEKDLIFLGNVDE